MDCATFAAVCIRADHLPKGASPIPELADHLLERLSEACTLINHEDESFVALISDCNHTIGYQVSRKL